MIVIRENELEFVPSPGKNRSAGVATPSRGAQEVSVVRQRQAAQGSNPAHTHDREEVLVVTRGSVSVTVGTASVTLSAGDALIVPAETPHRLANEGEIDAEWLLVAPAGVGFFHESGERANPPWAQ